MIPYPDNEPISANDGETDLLDMALVLIENLKVLILAPLLVAAGVGTALWLSPPTYQSEAIQTGDPLLAAMYNSVAVHDAVAQKLHPQWQGSDLAQASMQVRQALQVSYNAKEKSVRLVASAASAQEAQQMLAWVLATGAKLNETRTAEVSRLKAQHETLLAREQEYLQAARQLSDIVQKNQQGAVVGTLTQNQAQLINAAKDSLVAAADVATALEKVEKFDVIQAPTWPLRPVSKKSAQWILLSALGTALVLLMLVFLRQAWRHAASNPLTSEKVRRIRAAWSGRKQKADL